MATRAFLLCGDEKAVQAVTQILDELEVSFEHSAEPPFALKRLAGQRFDLLIVDCDNVQNATQVFNSARASNLNKTSIAIAIVEGKAGVPNAFRLGASLVLTKPVSLEQARNTLRTGIGMTRKDAPEAKAAAPAAPPAAASIPISPLVPVAPIPSAFASAVSGPVPVNLAPPVSSPASHVAQTPAPVVAPPKPAATFAPVASAKVAPVSEKPPVVLKPAVAPAPPAQEYKTALTDFTVPDADDEPKPAAGVTATAKAAAASGKTLPSKGMNSSEPVPKETGSLKTASTKEVAKPKLLVAKSDEEEDEESQDEEVLSVSDALSEEEETLDPVKDYGVPSFGGLGSQSFAGASKPKRSIRGWRIAAMALAVVGGGGYAAWATQPTFRDFATWEYGNIKNKIAQYPGEPQSDIVSAKQQPVSSSAPAPAPAATPAVPAPGSEEINLTLDASSTSAADPDATAPTSGDTTPENAPQVSSAVADGKTQKGATVQSARQDSNHKPANAALVPASLPPATSAKASSDLLEVPEDFADDQVVHRVHPVYPKQARVHKVQGTVVLQAIVNKQGKVDSLQLVSGDSVLAAAAADAVKQWRYKPYLHNGDYTDFQTRVTVDFKLP